MLSAKNQELSEEISSGAPTERKIFELASSQAKRENLHGAHNDTREIAFNQVGICGCVWLCCALWVGVMCGCVNLTSLLSVIFP